MAIEGSLSDVSLADICQLLALGRKTGCLTITDRSDFGYVYFRDGRVIHASVLNLFNSERKFVAVAEGLGIQARVVSDNEPLPALLESLRDRVDEN